MKLQTNKRPYNTIGVVHHITMDKWEFEYIRTSIKPTRAMLNFTNEIDKFKFDAFTDMKFVAIITPDDCEKPDHKLSFLFLGKVDPKYVNKFNYDMEKMGYSCRINDQPTVCVYCANTDRFHKIEGLKIFFGDDVEKNLLVEGPAKIGQDGLCRMFGDENTYYGMSFNEDRLLEIIRK